MFALEHGEDEILGAQFAQHTARLAALDALIATLDPDVPWPQGAADGPRGRAGSPRVVALPENWLASREVDETWARRLAAAELSVDGG